MAKIEGVTLEFYLIKEDKDSNTDINSFVSRLCTPYKHLEEKIGATLENKLEIGTFDRGDTLLTLNIRGNSDTIEKAMDYILQTYGLPSCILNPNIVFKGKDTESGIEIASNYFKKKGYKLKGKPYTFLRKDVKYFIVKKSFFFR